MLLEKLIDEIESLYPLDLSEEWDYPGLVFGEISADVSKVLISVDITNAVIDEAIDVGANLIISHHPMFFRPVHLLGSDTFRGKMLNKLAQNKIAHYFAHTNADNQEGGTKTMLSQLVNQIPKGLELNEFSRRLAEKFNGKVPKTALTLKVCGDPKRVINSWFVSPGSGDTFFEDAHKENADVFISSDLRHHPVQDAYAQYGFAIIDTPHFVSEYLWLYNLEDQLKNLGLEVHRSELNTDPWNTVIV